MLSLLGCEIMAEENPVKLITPSVDTGASMSGRDGRDSTERQCGLTDDTSVTE